MTGVKLDKMLDSGCGTAIDKEEKETMENRGPKRMQLPIVANPIIDLVGVWTAGLKSIISCLTNC